MTPNLLQLQHTTRRHFLRDGSMGLGAAALAMLSLGERQVQAATPLNPFAPRPSHFPAKAKRVIYLHLAGSPPHLDLFDYKPELVKRTGENCPDSFLKGKRFAFTSGVPKLLGTPRTFKQHGQSGQWISDAMPLLSTVADEVCFIKSMFSDQFNHAPAELLLYTGSPQFGRPSMGSWATWGLGSETQNLPGFIVLVSSGTQPSAGHANWSSGFLPSVYQGVQCRSAGEPVLYVNNPKGMNEATRRLSLDAMRDLNEMQAADMGSPETITRIAQYEMAFRMQTAVPEVMDINKEKPEMIETYGAKPGGASFANNCLLARRLIEQGVRFVQLHDWGWDFHGTNPGEDIRDGLTRKAATIDKPITALITDLKSRGLLDSTLIVVGGEFGRTPFREGRTAGGQVLGRDHHPHCFTLFMAGGGIKGGVTHGASDDLGLEVAENMVHVHDLQATILHLLGLNHLNLTYRYSGRDFRLTDVHGHVVKPVLA